jgi:acyl carrier protein
VTREELRAHTLEALVGVAPEVDPATLRGNVALRDQLDLDSMDFLNFLVAVHQRTGVEIPEADYGKLATLDQLVAYLARKTGAG